MADFFPTLNQGALEGAIGRTIVDLDTDGGWPVIVLDDGSRLVATASNAGDVWVEREAPSTLPRSPKAGGHPDA